MNRSFVVDFKGSVTAAMIYDLCSYYRDGHARTDTDFLFYYIFLLHTVLSACQDPFL